MLAHGNRVITGADFKRIVRGGRKVSTPSAVVYMCTTSETSPSRFGFIVAKTVGSSVVRNRVRRRLRAIGRELLTDSSSGSDFVIRPLPASSTATWSELRGDIIEAVHRSAARR